jgi:hypothetical protein
VDLNKKSPHPLGDLDSATRERLTSHRRSDWKPFG